jgi:hypothetical protein
MSRRPIDRVMRFFAVRLCLYALAGLVATLGMSLTGGDGWLSEMRQGIFPWVTLAMVNELLYRLNHRSKPVTKGARTRWSGIVVVDGTRFRWAAVRDDESAAVAIERAGGRGRRIVAQVEHDEAITPELVEQIIHEAVEHGWAPRKRGRQVTFRMVGTDRPTLTNGPPAS